MGKVDYLQQKLLILRLSEVRGKHSYLASHPTVLLCTPTNSRMT